MGKEEIEQIEIGPRDVVNGQVTYMRRDQLRDGDKVRSINVARDRFVAEAPRLLTEIQVRLFSEAKTRLDTNIRSDIESFEQLADFFGAAGEEDEAVEFRGWVRAAWCQPTGDALNQVEQRLKQLKLSIRNAPLGQSESSLGKCIFTGQKALQEILIARAY